MGSDLCKIIPGHTGDKNVLLIVFILSLLSLTRIGKNTLYGHGQLQSWAQQYLRVMDKVILSHCEATEEETKTVDPSITGLNKYGCIERITGEITSLIRGTLALRHTRTG